MPHHARRERVGTWETSIRPRPLWRSWAVPIAAEANPAEQFAETILPQNHRTGIKQPLEVHQPGRHTHNAWLEGH